MITSVNVGIIKIINEGSSYLEFIGSAGRNAIEIENCRYGCKHIGLKDYSILFITSGEVKASTGNQNSMIGIASLLQGLLSYFLTCSSFFEGRKSFVNGMIFSIMYLNFSSHTLEIGCVFLV